MRWKNLLMHHLNTGKIYPFCFCSLYFIFKITISSDWICKDNKLMCMASMKSRETKVYKTDRSVRSCYWKNASNCTQQPFVALVHYMDLALSSVCNVWRVLNVVELFQELPWTNFSPSNRRNNISKGLKYHFQNQLMRPSPTCVLRSHSNKKFFSKFHDISLIICHTWHENLN